jgi:hypothetical protein
MTPFAIRRPFRPHAPGRAAQFWGRVTTLRRRVRFHLRGLWRSLHSVPLNGPLPRPTHDF